MPLNRQLIFDTATAGLHKQGRKSMDEGDTMCAYRGENGAMCAIGFCIPNNRYKVGYEGQGIERILEAIGAKFGVADERSEWQGGNGDKEFLSSMQQRLHDDMPERLSPSRFRQNLRARARSFAKDHNLKVDVNLFTTE